MGQSVLILLAIFIPVLWGLVLLVKPEFKNRKALLTVSGAGLIIAAVLGCAVIFGGEQEVLLFSFGKNMNIFFHVDAVSRLFATVVTLHLHEKRYSYSFQRKTITLPVLHQK